MFIKGNCAIYIDKNLKVYENNTGILILCQLQLHSLDFDYKNQN